MSHGAPNAEIADVLDDVAELLELEEANPFRVRAYRNAGRVVRGLETEVASLLETGHPLPKLPGIGADLAGKIAEIARTGHLALLDDLRGRTPPIAAELLKLPGLGPKRVTTLCRNLDLHSMEQLHRAALDGRLRDLPGFGPTVEQKLLHALESRPKGPGRIQFAVAEAIARPLVEYLQLGHDIQRVTIAGSFRRCQDTVGDLDILAVSESRKAAIDWFTRYEAVEKVLAAGPTRATVVLRSGIQVDLRIVAPQAFGAALQYFTGSKAHSIALRRRAQERGLKINEYGVFRGEARLAGATEAEVYASVGLPLIPPELREDRGEFEAAAAGRLPSLVELSDLEGDLHTHTTATDGTSSLEGMAAAAKSYGLDYIAVTEHSRRLAMVHGLSPERLLKQGEEIDRINATGRGATLLKGIEVDILEDGRLDLPDEALARLDLVVASIHSRFELSRERQTARILKAMERPFFTILAHPTGRLIGERAPYDVDMPRIIRGAKERGCFLELNAHPERLDLVDLHCRMAKDAGVLVSIASDAHRVGDFACLRYGIGQARRGWLEPADVLNTRPLSALRFLLKATRLV
jgi:DNA polymerase (family 10)